MQSISRKPSISSVPLVRKPDEVNLAVHIEMYLSDILPT